MNYKDKHKVSFPSFTFFVQFIRDMSKIKNDPGFSYDIPSEHQVKKQKMPSAISQHSRPQVSAEKKLT